MKFHSTFSKWLDQAIPAALPKEVRAFSFNLINVYGKEYAIEVIGAERFDANDPDWRCDEIWEPSPRMIDIPSGALGVDWEDVLEAASKLVLGYLEVGAKKDTLKSSHAIGIGFVDGDPYLLWNK